MEKLTKEIEAILLERFGTDSIVALATAIDNIPYVRSVMRFMRTELSMCSPTDYRVK